MIRIGFIINSRDHRWIGGINYYKNLLNAIISLPDRKIEPILFTGYYTPKTILEDINNIKIIKNHMFDFYHPLSNVRYLIRILFKWDILLEYLLKKNNITILSHYYPLRDKSDIPTIGWIPDFQHKYLPNFFSKKELHNRNDSFNIICRNSLRVILSSNTAKTDAMKFFPEYASKFRVLHFIASNMNLYNLPKLEEIKEKYNLDPPYFLVPNQFWIHKNHQIIIEALRILKNNGHSINIIATGDTQDYRNPQYYHDLQQKLTDYHISQNFRILGLIPYSHLIQLMLHSIAVINPSYFEGWSTTVEEAKILDLKILLSDIPVHREQNPERAQFFAPDDAQKLADLLLIARTEYQQQAHQESVSDIIMKKMEKQKKEFARNYEKIVLEALADINISRIKY